MGYKYNVDMLKHLEKDLEEHQKKEGVLRSRVNKMRRYISICNVLTEEGKASEIKEILSLGDNKDELEWTGENEPILVENPIDVVV